MENNLLNESGWFTIDPYVYLTSTDSAILLYNTLDSAIVESDDKEIVEIVKRISDKKNCGVCMLKKEELSKENIRLFIHEVRDKYMGDLVPVSLSESKPVQLLPILNFQQDKKRLEKQPNISIGENILSYLHEVTIYIDKNSALNISKWYSLLNQIHSVPVLKIKGNFWEYPDISLLIRGLEQTSSIKHMIVFLDLCKEEKISNIPIEDFKFDIYIDFPVSTEQFENAISLFSKRNRVFNLTFKVSSEEDVMEAEELIEKFRIDNYKIEPFFNGNNLSFFEKNIYMTKEDLTNSTPLSLREIFAHQNINSADFGKITISPNGDVYANPHFAMLGNIHTHTIKEILYKEISEGKSWLRIRDEEPCNTCLYQWICPSPSDYELEIGKMNLCHIK